MKGVLSMCFFRKRKERHRILEQERAALGTEQQKRSIFIDEKMGEPRPQVEVQKIVETPVIEQVSEEPEMVVETPIVVTPVVEPVVEPVALEPKKVEPTPVVEKIVEQPVQKEKAPKIPKYHVSQNKDENTENFKKWRVRKEGSEKTIKFFDTQKEAIDYASALAESAGSTVVIHKVDGNIRKQDYTKKE